MWSHASLDGIVIRTNLDAGITLAKEPGHIVWRARQLGVYDALDALVLKSTLRKVCLGREALSMHLVIRVPGDLFPQGGCRRSPVRSFEKMKAAAASMLRPVELPAFRPKLPKVVASGACRISRARSGRRFMMTSYIGKLKAGIKIVRGELVDAHMLPWPRPCPK